MGQRPVESCCCADRCGPVGGDGPAQWGFQRLGLQSSAAHGHFPARCANKFPWDATAWQHLRPQMAARRTPVLMEESTQPPMPGDGAFQSDRARTPNVHVRVPGIRATVVHAPCTDSHVPVPAPVRGLRRRRCGLCRPRARACAGAGCSLVFAGWSASCPRGRGGSALRLPQRATCPPWTDGGGAAAAGVPPGRGLACSPTSRRGDSNKCGAAAQVTTLQRHDVVTLPGLGLHSPLHAAQRLALHGATSTAQPLPRPGSAAPQWHGAATG